MLFCKDWLEKAFFLWTPVSLEAIVRQWFSLKSAGRIDCFQQWKLFEAHFELHWCLEIVPLSGAPTGTGSHGRRGERKAERIRAISSFPHLVRLTSRLLSRQVCIWVFLEDFLRRGLYSLRSKRWPSQTANSPISGWEGEGGRTSSPCNYLQSPPEQPPTQLPAST